MKSNFTAAIKYNIDNQTMQFKQTVQLISGRFNKTQYFVLTYILNVAKRLQYKYLFSMNLLTRAAGISKH